MDKNNRQIKELRKVESIINRNLYLLCSALTLLTMIVFLVEFFSRGAFPNFRINIFYLGVLLIYSAHKELIRLMGKKNFWHHGEYFVYSWVAITIVLYLVNFLTKGYYTYSPTNQQSTVLTDVSLITLQVMGVFILSRAFKIIRVSYELKNK
jgi:hypothetical protein